MGDDGFLWLGNHPAADLCNTEPMVDGHPVELLGTYDDLVRWACHAAIGAGIGADGGAGGAPRCDPRVERQTLAWVRRLRTQLRALLDPPAPASPDVGPLNALLSHDRGTLHLRAGDLAVGLTADDEVAQFRLDLASAVLDVFTRDGGLVRRCGNPACVLLFLDTSKSRRRRWCDMATCGNRAKAAAHYARRHAPS